MFSEDYNIPQDEDFSLHPRSLVFTCSLSLSYAHPAVWASQLWDGTDISPQGAARTDHLHAYCTLVDATGISCRAAEEKVPKPCETETTTSLKMQPETRGSRADAIFE